jgi:hypothetical protein
MAGIADLSKTPADVAADRVTNYHVLSVKYLGATNYTDARVKIISPRFKDSVTFPWPHETPLNSAVRVAASYLIARGWKVVGIAEGPDAPPHDYLITNTFDRLPRPVRSKRGGVAGAKRRAKRKAPRKVARRRRR